MSQTGSVTTGGVGDKIAAIRRWYEGHRRDSGEHNGFVVEEVDAATVWMTFDLRATALAGRTVEAFVEDRGSGRWLQGWCDGDRLSLAASHGSLGFALMFLEELMPAEDERPLG